MHGTSTILMSNQQVIPTHESKVTFVLVDVLVEQLEVAAHEVVVRWPQRRREHNFVDVPAAALVLYQKWGNKSTDLKSRSHSAGERLISLTSERRHSVLQVDSAEISLGCIKVQVLAIARHCPQQWQENHRAHILHTLCLPPSL